MAVDSGPSRRAVAVTPNDVNTIGVPRAIFVGGAGNITMRGADDTADTLWSNVAAGSTLAFCPQFIRATGTTATGILALY